MRDLGKIKGHTAKKGRSRMDSTIKNANEIGVVRGNRKIKYK